LNPFRYFLFFIFFFTLIVSCKHTTVRENNKIQTYDENGNLIKIINNVVYIAQNDNYSCATTSVAMAVSYFLFDNKPLDKETIWELSGTNKSFVLNYGNDMYGLKKITDSYNLRSEYKTNLTISDLEKLLIEGALIVLNIKVNETGSSTHAILAVGFNKKGEYLYIKDPSISDNYLFYYSDLKKRWSAHLSLPRGMSFRSGFIIYPDTIKKAIMENGT
jgi:hypothetical protein